MHETATPFPTVSEDFDGIVAAAEAAGASVPTQPMEITRWRVGLYEVDVSASDEVSGAQASFKMLQTGLESLAGAQKSSAGDPP